MVPKLVVFTCVAGIACGGSRSTPSAESTPAVTDGQYEFSATTPTQQIRGTIRVESGSFRLEYLTPCAAQTRTSRFALPTTAAGSSRYFCGDAVLTFDRRNPAIAAWYAIVEVARQRQVCDRYESQGGRQVCVGQRTETYMVPQTQSGGIQVRRVP
jgi:hypothetical protein